MFKTLSEGMRQALPIPGISELVDGFGKVDTTSLSDRRAKLLSHISMIQDKLNDSNAIHQHELRDQLDATTRELNKDCHTRLSRVMRSGDTLATLEELEGRVGKSVDQYSVAAAEGNSKAMKDVNTDLKVLRSETESLDERVSKNETEVSRLQGLINSIKGLCQKTSEAFEGMVPPILSSSPFFGLGLVPVFTDVHIPPAGWSMWRCTIQPNLDENFYQYFLFRTRLCQYDPASNLLRYCMNHSLLPTQANLLNSLRNRTQSFLAAAEGFRAIASTIMNQPICELSHVCDPTSMPRPDFSPSTT